MEAVRAYDVLMNRGGIQCGDQRKMQRPASMKRLRDRGGLLFG